MPKRPPFHRLMLGSAALLALAAGSQATAETLQQALLQAYQTNPTLTGARAGQRANDENVPIQKAGARPRLTTGADYTEVLKRPANSFNAPERSIAADATLSVPIYSGGSVRNGIKAAKTRVESGQANLRATEASVFSRVVAAYMDVMRDTAIVSLNRANVNVLSVNLDATNDRFEVGDLTRTDIAQSESRLALARSQLQTAEANLINSRENYIALVGTPPDDLQQPPPLPNLPATPDDAVDVAMADNPDIIAARKEREAARYDTKAARAGRLPTLSAFTQGAYTNYLGTLGSSIGASVAQTQTQASAGLSATVPLYQGGQPAARIRQRQAFESQAIEGEIETERAVIAQARAAFASWQAAVQTIQSSKVAVDASALSLEGVRAENTVGSRTILDILDAEQEALRARVELVSAERNAYVAGFTLLAAMGHAEADDLSLDAGILYDPMVNYNRVRGKILDWSDDPAPKPVATRTVDSPAQNANVDAAAAQ